MLKPLLQSLAVTTLPWKRLPTKAVGIISVAADPNGSAHQSLVACIASPNEMRAAASWSVLRGKQQ